MSSRLALVLGNSDYKFAGKLNNPCNDAKDIARCLSDMNFKVNIYLDLSQNDLVSAIIQFKKELINYSTVLFYYAGHGMQIKGKNYLVPIDCEITSEDETLLSCYDLDDFFKEKIYKDKTNIIILDSCRTNPFSSMLRGSMKSGFAAIDKPPQGTIISFATSPDSAAADGDGNNGLFTGVLKSYISKPNIEIRQLFQMVRTKVAELSGDSQIAWEHCCLTGDFYFVVKPVTSSNDICDAEIFEYIQQRSKYYDKIGGLDLYDNECLPYIDAYEKYKIPIIEILRKYSRVNYNRQNRAFSDEDIDFININYLASWGFKYKDYRWYFRDKYVQMGDPLPLSDEFKEIPPIIGQELFVKINLSAKMKDGLLYFDSTTNLPDGTLFMYSLSSKSGDYSAGCKSSVQKSIISSEGFSNKKQTINDGVYTVTLTSPIYDLQPERLKCIFGKRNRNLIGEYIKYSSFGGNTINYSKIIVKEKDKISVY